MQRKLLNANFKGAFLSSEDHISYMNQKSFRKIFFHSAQEIITSFNLCIYMHIQSCLTQKINENILYLQSNGLMQTWAKQFVDYSYLKEKSINEPKVLVLDQLLGAFELLAFGFAISLLSFVVEIISTKVLLLRRFVMKL
jgi:hypothetical protein